MKLKAIILQSIFIAGCFFCCTIGNTQNWDINLLRDINPQHPNSFVWKGFTSFAYSISAATPVLIWAEAKIHHIQKEEYKAYEIAGSVIIAAGATEAVKIVFNRERPAQRYVDVYPYKYETGRSFLSRHASLAFATATSLSIEYKKWDVVVPAYAWAFGVGYSRLYLGEHYPTDIIGSAVTGAGSAVVSYWLSKKVFKQKRLNRNVKTRKAQFCLGKLTQTILFGWNFLCEKVVKKAYV